jgi:hypothetical protein
MRRRPARDGFSLLAALAALAALPVAGGCGDNDNVPPAVEDQFVETAEDTPVDIELVATDPNGDPLVFEVIQAPMNGTLSGAAPRLTYTPDLDFFGADQLLVGISDGASTETIAVTIMVTPVNDAPSIAVLSGSLATDEDTPLGPVDIPIGDVDDELAELVLTASSSNQAIIADGGIAIDGAALTLTPVADAFGVATVTVTVSDGELDASASFEVSVAAVNDAPTITAIENQSTRQAPVGPVDFAVADVDDLAGDLVVTATSSDQSVIADANLLIEGAGADRTITLTPSGAGTATITVTVDDGAATGETAFAFEVTNQAPTANPDSYVATGNTPLAVSAALGVLANDLDGDGDSLTLTPIVDGSTSRGGVVSLAADGSFTYVPVTGDTGVADSFSYVINDGLDDATGTVTLNLEERVWYVDNSAAGGDGSFAAPFATLEAAETASGNGDILFLFAGDGTTAGQDQGVTLQDDQQLIGEGAGLTVNGVEIVPAGDAPVITNTAGVGVQLDSNAANHTIAGLTIDAASNDGISGPSVLSLVIATVTINIGGNAAIDIGNNNPSGTVTIEIRDSIIDGLAAPDPELGIDIAFGTSGGNGTLDLDVHNNVIEGVLTGVLLNLDNAVGSGPDGANRIRIADNVISDFTQEGIDLGPDDTSVSAVRITGNNITGDTAAAGISDVGVELRVALEAGGEIELTVADNAIASVGRDCILVAGRTASSLGAGALVSLVSGNQLSGCTDAGMSFQGEDTASWSVVARANIMTGNGSESSFGFLGNIGATLALLLEDNEDDQGFSLERDADGALLLGGDLGTGSAFDDDNGNVADRGNTTGGAAPIVSIVGTGNQIEIIDPTTIPEPATAP